MTKRIVKMAVMMGIPLLLATGTVAAQGAKRWKSYVKLPGATLVVGCSYAVAPTNCTVAAQGGTFDVTVTTNGTCAWTTSSQASWLHVTVLGANAARVTADASPGWVARAGDVQVAGKTIRVCQQANSPVVTSVGPGEIVCDGRGGYSWRNVAVAAPAGSSWSTSSPDGWITVIGGCGKTGDGNVDFLTAANHTGSTRTGSILIGGRWVVVIQPVAEP